MKQLTILNIDDAFESIDELWLHNWKMYLETGDNNWFVDGFTGKEKKIDSKLLTEVENILVDQFCERMDDTGMKTRIRKLAKRNWLQTKYQNIDAILNLLFEGFGVSDTQQECRYNLIVELKQYGLNMDIMATPHEDKIAVNQLCQRIQNLKTQIALLDNELKTDGKKESFNVNRELILIGQALQIGYRLNAKQITAGEYIEMIKLCNEKAKQN